MCQIQACRVKERASKLPKAVCESQQGNQLLSILLFYYSIIVLVIASILFSLSCGRKS